MSKEDIRDSDLDVVGKNINKHINSIQKSVGEGFATLRKDDPAMLMYLYESFLNLEKSLDQISARAGSVADRMSRWDDFWGSVGNK